MTPSIYDIATTHAMERAQQIAHDLAGKRMKAEQKRRDAEMYGIEEEQ